ncbi:hydroxylysine kinase [Aplysia californica]|uniref:Hydroxylysine kinase n=1 Tax=Aplysia californica TaxID=6500 RepID=A0ABM1AG48_APLCA|nr:hydroxylysine kinase [Aplysia californica]
MKATSKAGEERVHKLAVRTFIPGKELGKVTLTPFILYKVGVFVAQLTRALEDFSHSFFDTFDHIWSLNHFPKVAKGLFAVRDETRRRICEEVLEAFNTEVIPQKAHFRKGHIHGDLNVENILVCETVGQGKSFRVCGLLDFQHSASSYLLYELVICTAYAMMAVSTEVPRPLIPGYVLAGYSSILQLNKAERKVFYNLIASRMVQSLVYGAYNAYLDPANEYVLSTAMCGWETLKQFWETPSKDLEKEWGQIVETYVP